jgi:peptide/nickel transport system substrate-binding protein
MDDVTGFTPDDSAGESCGRGPEGSSLLARGITRRGVLKSGAAGAAAVSGASLLAACGGGGGGGANTGPSGKPVRGGTLTVAMISHGGSETMSVWQSQTNLDESRIFSLYDPLFEFDSDGINPALAESAEPNADATVWTFTLRKGVTWHDGTPLTADDLLYTIKNWVSPLNYYSATLAAIIDAKNARKRDRYTVEVPLLKPVADLPSFTSFYQAYVIKDGTKEKDFNSNPVGTGAFKFESFIPGKRSVFQANHNYWRPGLPYVDKLVIDSSYTQDSARLNAVEAGTADTAPAVDFGLSAANRSNKSYRISSAIGSSNYQFTMNLKTPPFDDVRVRQAMRLLADRQGIVNSALAGYGTPGNDLPGRGLKHFASDFHRERDVEQARSLLKQAGRQDLAVTLAASNIDPGLPDCATLYARNAADGGVNVNVKMVDPSVWYTAPAGYLKRPFSVGCPGAGDDVPSLSEYYLITMWSGAAYPETHFGNPRDDALLFDAIGELDPAKANDKWHEVQKVQFDSGGYLIFANQSYVDAYRNEVGGINATYAGPADGLQFRKAWKKT